MKAAPTAPAPSPEPPGPAAGETVWTAEPDAAALSRLVEALADLAATRHLARLKETTP